MVNPAYVPGPLTISQLRELEGLEHSGGLPLNATSRALEASRLVKATQGKLFGVSVTNTNAAARFFLVFDSAILPADGVVPVISFSVPASQAGGLYFGSVGRAFEQGIVICNSTTQGAKTIAAADSLFDAQYI